MVKLTKKLQIVFHIIMISLIVIAIAKAQVLFAMTGALFIIYVDTTKWGI